MNPAETYLIEASEPYRSILLHLQLLVATTLLEAEMKYKWKLPFY